MYRICTCLVKTYVHNFVSILLDTVIFNCYSFITYSFFQKCLMCKHGKKELILMYDLYTSMMVFKKYTMWQSLLVKHF